MKKFISRILAHPRLLFALAAIMCMGVEVFYFFCQWPLSEPPSPSSRVITSLVDAAVVFFPFLFLKKRWQWLVLVPFVVLPAIILANVAYLRSFGDIIAPVLYFHGTPFDPIVVKGALYALRPSDAVLLAAAVASVAAFLLLRERISECSASARFRRCYIAGMCAGLIACGAMIYRRYAIWYESWKPKDVYNTMFVDNICTWDNYFLYQGFLWYAGVCAMQTFDIPTDISDDERARVETYFEERRRSRACAGSIDSRAAGAPLNLIYIIVESWSPRLFETPEGRAAMPVVMALAEDSTVIFRKDFINNTGVGRSSDGQFIYNTGLLPLKSEALVFNYCYKPFPGLARAFENSVEVIGEDAVVWSHRATNEAYGFRGLVDKLSEEGEDGDSIIFRRAAEVARTLPEPFYMEVTTLTMHHPYAKSGVPDNFPAGFGDTLDPRDRNYLLRVNFFDRQLGAFLGALRESGLYERSLIVLASDHDLNPISVSEAMYSPDIPVMILNSPRTDVPDGRFRQIDLYPTILDLTGRRVEAFGGEYRGLGESIFDRPGEPRDTVLDREREISEIIIRKK